jgi:hypothetical protein
MSKPATNSRLFLISRSENADTAPMELTDDDLQQAFEQVSFDLDSLLDENGDEGA